jgi:hypothetical protein
LSVLLSLLSQHISNHRPQANPLICPLCFHWLPFIAQGLPLSQLGDPTANYLTSHHF